MPEGESPKQGRWTVLIAAAVTTTCRSSTSQAEMASMRQEAEEADRSSVRTPIASLTVGELLARPPAVLTGCTKGWGAHQAWGIAELEERYRDTEFYFEEPRTGGERRGTRF
eukprot:Hpha_TRINITY_DN29365_c0_g1::TRINITY_DN29365_c0_g1_i1::g.112446::m.112446